MWQKFTMSARNTIMVGQEKAIELHRDEVGTDLILWALISQQDDAAARLLKNMNAPLDTIRSQLEAEFSVRAEKAEAKSAEPKLTGGAKSVLEYSAEEARRLSKPNCDISTEHILLGLLRLTADTPLSYTLLRNSGVTLEAARLQLQQFS